MPIYIGNKKAYTTSEVAKLAGIHWQTLRLWLSHGALREPRHGKIGEIGLRLWSERDLERVLRHKARAYKRRDDRHRPGKMT